MDGSKLVLYELLYAFAAQTHYCGVKINGGVTSKLPKLYPNLTSNPVA
ncbi:hypothetical protein COO91_05162 [Nostoc flagelliforme CCNUN1]|uniref:Uncharacterized protein n=1 Tax=Nostoc flagelliforme CCNUN1 TaxID=2038116 RepID=A0A2K8SUZ6_9NOSO|nr:hypothetical protein COO91_05162 [Nostoc flagelliforme CCNUN1]